MRNLSTVVINWNQKVEYLPLRYINSIHHTAKAFGVSSYLRTKFLEKVPIIHRETIKVPMQTGQEAELNVSWITGTYNGTDVPDTHNKRTYRIATADLGDTRTAYDNYPDWWLGVDNPYLRRNGRHSCSATCYAARTGIPFSKVDQSECFGSLRNNDHLQTGAKAYVDYNCNPVIGGFDYDRSKAVLSTAEQLRFMELLVENNFIPPCDMNLVEKAHTYRMFYHPRMMSGSRFFFNLVNVRYTVEQAAMVWDILNAVDNLGWDFYTAWTAFHFNHSLYDSEHNALWPLWHSTWDEYVNNYNSNCYDGNSGGVSERTAIISPIWIIQKALLTYWFVNYSCYNPGYRTLYQKGRWHLQHDYSENERLIDPILEQYKDETDLEMLANWSPRNHGIEKLMGGYYWNI